MFRLINRYAFGISEDFMASWWLGFTCVLAYWPMGAIDDGHVTQSGL